MGLLDFFRRRVLQPGTGSLPQASRPAETSLPPKGLPEWIARLMAAEKEWDDGETEPLVDERSVAGHTQSLVEKLRAADGEDQAQAFYSTLEEEYVQAARPHREALRAAVRADGQLDALIAAQLERFWEQAVAAGNAVQALRSPLLVYSLTYRYDSREALVALSELWRWAEQKGLDPMPHYRAIGRIASSEVTHVVGGSAKGMFVRVAFDADYRAQLKW